MLPKDENPSFRSLPLSEEVQAVLGELGFQQMTPIQAEAIPALLSGRDVVGQSETGSGKTAAFGIPLLEKVDTSRRQLQALVVCPTRELCTQVARQIRVLGRKQRDLQVLTLTGGQRIAPQMDSLEKGVHIAVGTPGRIVDHLERGSLQLSQLRFLVLDEGDRMLEMGFEEDMRKVIAASSSSRQTALFSATVPEELKALIPRVLIRPLWIHINPEGGLPEIEERFYEANVEEKPRIVLQLLGESQPESAIVFCNTKATVNELTALLRSRRMSAACLHGDLEQRDRDRELAKFRNKSTRVLVASDVAARGIDVENVDLVVNYDLPRQPEVYVHRVGRTARAGKSGIAVSLVDGPESSRLLEIEPLTGKTYEVKTWNFTSGNWQLPASMKTLFVGGGRKNKIRPTDLLGALTGEAGRLQGSQVGKIHIGDHHAYVAIDAKVAGSALARLRSGKIKGRKYPVDFAH